MRSKVPKLINKGQLDKGRKALVYHKSSKQNEPNEWIRATVASVDEHMAMCKRATKGPPMCITYEDLRLLPDGELTQELMSKEVEDDAKDGMIEVSDERMTTSVRQWL